MITVVSGFGRCGSSMAMQMLVAGGMKPGSYQVHPMYEDGRQTQPCADAWIDEYQGKVLKWLDPIDFTPPFGPDYCVLWMVRDPLQQSKSYAKYCRVRFGGMTTQERKNVAARIKRDTKPAIRIWKELGAAVKPVQYEDILQNPLAAASVMASHVGITGILEIQAMADVVVQRSADCYKGFLENKLHREGPK